MSVEKEIETLEEQNPVTANANAGDKSPKKLEGETPGNSTSPRIWVDLSSNLMTPPPSAKKAAGAMSHEGDKSLKTKPSAASAKMEETEVEEEVVAEKTEIEVDVKADVEAYSTEKSFPRTSNLKLPQSLKAFVS